MQEHVDSPQGSTGVTNAIVTAATGTAARKRKRFLIIHNPIAGRNRIGLVQEVVRRLEQAGAVADLHLVPDAAGSDYSTLSIDSYDVLVASGGDGTARSMASLLRGRDMPFGLIPVGTGNVLAEELQLPRRGDEIAEMLLNGPVVSLSTASVNGAPCLLMLGVGFDGEVIARLPLELKRRIGKPSYGWPVLAALAHKPQTFSATIDGKECVASWLVVANAARYGGRFLLSPRTNVLSAGFNVVISHATSRRQRLWELFLLAAGRLERASTIEMMPAQTVDIPHAENLAVQIDGETIASPSFRIVADVARMPMIVPARTTANG
jgi:diacylglycerol kinase family enzyme